MSYYEPHDFHVLRKAKKVRKVVGVLLAVLDRMPEPRYLVIGPVTSGRKTEEENRKRLHDGILYYKRQGIATLNYLPALKRAMEILTRESGMLPLSRGEEYKLQERLRAEFYEPIFRSGKIGALCIMSGSEKSLNVRWMFRFAREHGIVRRRLKEKLPAR